MKWRGYSTVGLALVTVFGLWGQQRGGSGSTTGSRSNTPSGVPGGQRQPGSVGTGRQDPFNNRGSGQSRQRQRIFISGKVILDSGTAPPESVTITRYCNAERIPETYTDSEGRFSFEVGGLGVVAIDASTSGASSLRSLGGGFGGVPIGNSERQGANLAGAGVGFNQIDLSGCDLRADLPGYMSDRISLGRRRALDNSDVGTIVLRRLGGLKGDAVSMTTLAAPRRAKKAYEKASKELRKKNAKSHSPQKAIKALEDAVTAYPEYAAAWTLLGETKMRVMDIVGARTALERALAVDPRYLRPYMPLLQLEMSQKRWTQADNLAKQVLKINPMLSSARYMQVVARFNGGRFAEAEEVAKILANGPDAEHFPQIHHLLGMIRTKRGDFSKAATAYRSFLVAQPGSPVASQLRKKMVEWEALGVIPKQ